MFETGFIIYYITREQLQKGLTFVVVDLSLSLSVFICIQVVSIKDTKNCSKTTKSAASIPGLTTSWPIKFYYILKPTSIPPNLSRFGILEFGKKRCFILNDCNLRLFLLNIFKKINYFLFFFRKIAHFLVFDRNIENELKKYFFFCIWYA